MVGKTTKGEDEYFIRQEIERMKELRAKHLAETAVEERERMKELHYLHCAKCGQHMETTTLANVEVEVCPDCGGIYLDAGELGKIVDEQQDGPFAKALGLARRLWTAE